MTKKQRAILMVVNRGNPDGSFVDVDQIIERVPYPARKDAIKLSLRILEGHGCIRRLPLEKRRGQKRRVIAPTPKGMQVTAPALSASEIGVSL
ncbi:hypothetical protein [Ectothiorhodospira shaposhnikovii]|uniref:hypothetical protein n=1 Tax=Ectothiorhodospira shaposhnikovii TaxID=1054 RepID=UPI001EE8312C|nr:hypothetical protein [Ectothiorhodospira shaposhnikovii]MCG5512847.1 hypothetical protein [Ectothiorhodospira shaposhnikovii]